MAIEVHILPAAELSVRDPQSTKLGKRILGEAIGLLDEIGLEAFTFKKLAARLDSTEAGVYRYFANKHQLLVYLVSWYWDWVHHLVNQAVIALTDPLERLHAAVGALTRPSITNPAVPYIDERTLHRVVVNEGSKAYHTKAVDQENQRGSFVGYKSLSEDVAALILAVRPDFPYPRSLATSLFEMAHNHPYFAEHLPRLTDIQQGDTQAGQLERMLLFWVDRLLKQ